ncbi:chaplin [Actinacidiphila guanduensis]|uniref:LPXTG-motif cell wall anchor domain-containing protein n=1 Tax=Actinacidiphila guanduensis TaxID=310781 RepID=A0A1G9VZ29_9ACTN|nr:chaplin [Actinacidiphila guanduensis]SDM77025.1 LPXTG-motif cell wall anchor domain-containing protein [Actinacidiphila guanduensis]
MNRIARKGLVTAVVAGGVLASAQAAHADATGGGQAAGSPGILSGNSVSVPVHVPVNACGNTVDAAGLLNPAFGNSCANTSTPPPTTPVAPPPPAHKPVPAPPNQPAPVAAPSLAHTGAAGVGWAGGAGAALVLGGAVLYRKARPAARR